MAIACAASVPAPPPTGKKRSSSSPSCRGFRQWCERRSHLLRGVAARFSRDPAGAGADAASGRIEDDSSYLWKLGLGSVGGAAVIKYGSILLPDITRPNILQALLMVSLPVAVAVLLLLKVSSSKD